MGKRTLLGWHGHIPLSGEYGGASLRRKLGPESCTHGEKALRQINAIFFESHGHRILDLDTSRIRVFCNILCVSESRPRQIHLKFHIAHGMDIAGHCRCKKLYYLCGKVSPTPVVQNPLSSRDQQTNIIALIWYRHFIELPYFHRLRGAG